MKKLLLALAALTLTLSLASCDLETQQGTGEGTDDPITVSSQEETPKDMDIKILGTTLGKDYGGDPILIVEYEFTNNTDEAKSFMFLCQDKAYQNGVECSSTVISDEIDTQQQLNDVKPGVPYQLKVGYALQDKTNPVEIEITELIGDEVFLKRTVNLQ